jgi:hypothetical protein
MYIYIFFRPSLFILFYYILIVHVNFNNDIYYLEDIVVG